MVGGYCKGYSEARGQQEIYSNTSCIWRKKAAIVDEGGPLSYLIDETTARSNAHTPHPATPRTVSITTPMPTTTVSRDDL
jgi:hypothetical protein